MFDPKDWKPCIGKASLIDVADDPTILSIRHIIKTIEEDGEFSPEMKKRAIEKIMEAINILRPM